MLEMQMPSPGEGLRMETKKLAGVARERYTEGGREGDKGQSR
jgi:hypothetical protein